MRVRFLKFALLSITTVFTGCETFYLGPQDTGIQDTGVVTLSPNPTVDITWGEDGIQIDIANGQGMEFRVGLTESTDACSINTEYGCWTAEDCMSGYITPQEDFAHPIYCHDIGSSGTTLTYSDSLIGVITGASADYVINGQQTAFPAPNTELSYEYDVTYYLEGTSTGANPTTECWTWGVNPGHFEEKNCKAPVPVLLEERRERWSLPRIWTPE